VIVDQQSARTRLTAHLREPLYRNGYFLVFSSVGASGLGVVFWLIAARRFDTATLGVNSAAISAMVFLANLAGFNLVNGLNRFLPRAGGQTRRLVATSYLIAGVMGTLVGAIFLLGLESWSPALGFLTADLGMAVWFALSVGIWAIFVLQDGALTGVRAAGWVPVENITYAVTKIVLLIVLAGVIPLSALFISWTVALVPMLLAVNMLLFRRLFPAHAAATSHDPEPFDGVVVARFVGGDYLASMLWMTTTNVLPVVVLQRAGAEAAAYFYLSWTVAYVLYLVSRNMGMSLLAESVHNPGGLIRFGYGTMRQTTLLLVPAVAVVVIAAPLILRIFGSEYSTEGAGLLRLLALSALPTVITSTYAAVLRSQRRVGALLVLMTAQAVLVLPASYLLLPRYGIVAVGAVWLSAHTLVAVVLLLTEMREFWVAKLGSGFTERAGAVRDRFLNRVRGAGLRRRAETLLVEAIGDAASRSLRHIPTRSDLAVFAAGSPGEPLILKLARSAAGAGAIDADEAVLGLLAHDPALDPIRDLLPRVIASGGDGRDRWVVQTRLPGSNAESLTGEVRASVIGQAERVASELHESSRVAVSDVERHSWFDRRLEVLRDAAGDRVDRLVPRVEPSLQRATFGRIHGDLWLGNVLVDGSMRISGLVDWEGSQTPAPQIVDRATLWLVELARSQAVDLGTAVAGIVASGWPDSANGLEEGDALLAWLQHCASGLSKSGRYQHGTAWFDRNVERVLADL
jgi:O-antigen/teichoic acid export membrane protein